MSIRWKKIAPLLAIATLLGSLPYIHRLIDPDSYSGIACVRKYPDGRLEKDMGESCYDPELPKALVLKSKK